MLTKYCPACKIEKPEDEFSWRNKPNGVRAPHCKVCYAAMRRDFYQRNRERIIAENRGRSGNNRKRYKEWKNTLCCKLCPEDDECALQFHHLDPNKKDFNVSSMTEAYGWDKIMKEAAKCIVVCGNCHTKIHKYGLEEYKQMRL